METVVEYVIMEVIVILPSIFFGVLRQKAARTGGRTEWTGGSRDTMWESGYEASGNLSCFCSTCKAHFSS